MNIIDIVRAILENPIYSFLATAGLIGYVIRDVLRTSNLRAAARTVADFIDQYARYDKQGALALENALIEYHNEAIKALEQNKTQ